MAATGADGYLDRILDYNTWANRGLLEFLAAQPSETLDLTAAGVYGTIRVTLEHLLRSELSYQGRLVNGGSFVRAEPLEHPGLADLQHMAADSAAGLASLLPSLPEPGTMIPLSDGKRAAATMLTQLVMHGVEHRAHVGTILGANGIEPPDLDSWAHGIRVHGDDWPAEWGPEPADRR
jgi:uncharacterized damage-inducible protein DinB